MRLIWTSKYRTFSLHTGLGVGIFSCLIVLAIVLGFFGGIAYQKTVARLAYYPKNLLSPLTAGADSPITHVENSVAASQALVDQAKAAEDTQMQIQALSHILAEMQAKLLTLQNLAGELPAQNPTNTNNASNTAPKKNNGFNFLDGMGGRFEAAAVFPRTTPTIDELLEKSSQSLMDINALESSLLQSRYRHLQHEAQDYFLPNLLPSVETRVTSRFGVRIDPFTYTYAMHRGVDFAAPVGTPIYAVAAGVVESVKLNGDFGHVLEIRHNQQLTSLYGHCSKIVVNEGDLVQKGQLIAYIGSTGRSSGPHLHLEIHVNDEPVNPEKYINVNGYLTAY